MWIRLILYVLNDQEALTILEVFSANGRTGGHMAHTMHEKVQMVMPPLVDLRLRKQLKRIGHPRPATAGKEQDWIVT
jgi:hypothetical protein